MNKDLGVMMFWHGCFMMFVSIVIWVASRFVTSVIIDTSVFVFCFGFSFVNMATGIYFKRKKQQIVVDNSYRK